MAYLMPNVLNYVLRTASSNDSLCGAPSGGGYIYPQLLQRPAQLTAVAEATQDMMRRSNQTLINVIGVTPTMESLQPFVNL